MLKKVFNISHISAGFTAVLVGYTSSVVIIIQAATAAGATAAQIESWLWALGLAMGLSSLLFSWFYKRPVLTAWSTPGAAMLVAAVGQYSMPEVIGALQKWLLHQKLQSGYPLQNSVLFLPFVLNVHKHFYLRRELAEHNA